MQFNNATQVYPEFVLFPTDYHTDINYNFYFKEPLVNVNYDGDELSAGVVFYIPLGGKSGLMYPLYTYQKALIFRIDYTKLVINLGSPDRYNHYSLGRTTVSIGYNF